MSARGRPRPPVASGAVRRPVGETFAQQQAARRAPAWRPGEQDLPVGRRGRGDIPLSASVLPGWSAWAGGCSGRSEPGAIADTRGPAPPRQREPELQTIAPGPCRVEGRCSGTGSRGRRQRSTRRARSVATTVLPRTARWVPAGRSARSVRSARPPAQGESLAAAARARVSCRRGRRRRGGIDGRTRVGGVCGDRGGACTRFAAGGPIHPAAYRVLFVPYPFFASLDSGEAVLRFPYDERLRTLLRAIPGRRWDPVEKAWRIPLDPECAQALAMLLTGLSSRPHVSDALARAIARRRGRRPRGECVLDLARPDENWWLSFPTDGDPELVQALDRTPRRLPAAGDRPGADPARRALASIVSGLLADGSDGLRLTEDAEHALTEIAQRERAAQPMQGVRSRSHAEARAGRARSSARARHSLARHDRRGG